MRKGFTMIEFLVAMVIFSLLATMALVSTKNTNETRLMKEMEDTLNLARLYSQNEFSKTFDYSNIDNKDYVDTDNNGLSDSLFGSKYLPIFNENIVLTKTDKTCGNGDPGILLTIKNSQVSKINSLSFDSCVSNKNIIN